MKEDIPPLAQSIQGTPIWLRVPQAVQLTGLSRSKVYELLAAGSIRSASLRNPGQRHATRLIDRADLLAFIERHVETK